MLLPTLAALLIWLFSSRIRARAALMHLRNLLSFALPRGFLFLLAYLLARVGLIPLYRFQVPTVDGPATSRSWLPRSSSSCSAWRSSSLLAALPGLLRPRGVQGGHGDGPALRRFL